MRFVRAAHIVSWDEDRAAPTVHTHVCGEGCYKLVGNSGERLLFVCI